MRRLLTVCVLLAGTCSISSVSAAAQEASCDAPITTIVFSSPIPFAASRAPLSSSHVSITSSESVNSLLRAGLPISTEMQAKIPRQVHSAQGLPGDVINFLIIGNQHDMKKAMDSAGWDTVSSTKLGVIWRDLFEGLYVKAYRGIPMSKLYLFGRAQDYGYAHSRGLLCVRNRHHFRIWRAPFEVEGQTLWIGAATHDVALHYLGRFLRFTHKIDPDVDAERQYVANTLTKSGRVQLLGYLTATDALTQARTATGQDFHTDGRTLVLQVVP
jgi:hypothetical protein